MSTWTTLHALRGPLTRAQQVLEAQPILPINDPPPLTLPDPLTRDEAEERLLALLGDLATYAIAMQIPTTHLWTQALDWAESDFAHAAGGHDVR